MCGSKKNIAKARAALVLVKSSKFQHRLSEPKAEFVMGKFVLLVILIELRTALSKKILCEIFAEKNSNFKFFNESMKSR